jgi:hypothetical protein
LQFANALIAVFLFHLIVRVNAVKTGDKGKGTFSNGADFSDKKN